MDTPGVDRLVVGMVFWAQRKGEVLGSLEPRHFK